MSTSRRALGILNLVTGGAATDIACNGLSWGNGLSFAMVLVPGGGQAGAARAGVLRLWRVLTRKAIGRDGGRSRQVIEVIDGQNVSRIHQVERNGKIIHQHQTHLGKHGSERDFPQEWLDVPTIDIR